MKRIFGLQIIILIVIIVVECTYEKNNRIDTKTTIYGKIENLDVYPNTKVISATIVDFRNKKSVFSDTIGPDGSFEIVFDLDRTQDVNVEPIVEKIILHPGENLKLGIDFKDIGNVRFYGENKKTNQDLHRYLNSNYCIYDFKMPRDVRILSPDSFKSLCDSAKSGMIAKRNNFILEINPTEEIQKWTLDYININYYYSLLDFLLRYSGSDTKTDTVNPILTYFSSKDSISYLFNSGIMNSGAYKILDAYIGLTIHKHFSSTLTDFM